MEATNLAKFGRIDETADPNFFVRFLDAASAAASVQVYKRRMLELLELRPGSRVLDVGCGTGDDVREMAKHVGAGGRIVGIDNSQAMIGVARQRAEGTENPVEFRVADVMELPFGAASFDSCRADRSLMHVPDAGQALAEMARVTKPGGRIVVYEVDFETLLIDAADRVLTRKILNTWCDSFRNGWLGRHIPALALDQGLEDIQIAPYTMLLSPPLAHLLMGKATVERAVAKAVVTAAEAQRWLEHLEELERSGRFFSSLTGFLVAARKAL
jgi:ubiquinone/menaquinone biosynthesis C-methylase UbiE